MKQQKNSTSGFYHLPIVIGILFALTIGVIGSQYVRHSSAATTEVNVATYNVRSQRWDGSNPKYDAWSARRDRVKGVVADARPGVIGMQEVIARNPETGKSSRQRSDVQKFMKNLGYRGYVGSSDNSSPIFWRSDNFKSLGSNEVELFSYKGDRAPRFLTYVRLKQVNTGKQLLVLNYHFNQFEERKDQLEKLGKYIKYTKDAYPKVDLVLTGDFNNYHDKVVSSADENGLKLRFADKYDDIDHVLVSPGVSIRGSKVYGPGDPAATDHSLVLGKLSI